MLQCKNGGAHAELLALSFMYRGSSPLYMDVPKSYKSQKNRPLMHQRFAEK